VKGDQKKNFITTNLHGDKETESIQKNKFSQGTIWDHSRYSTLNNVL